MPKAKVVLAGYIPVIHRGYIQFFDAYSEAKELYVFDENLLKKEDYLRKDLRALDSKTAAALCGRLDRFSSVYVLTESRLKKLDQNNVKIVLPDEDISRQVAALFKRAQTVFYPIFLRWDRGNVNALDKQPTTTAKKSDIQFMREAVEAANTSSDIWRRVGAALTTKTGDVVGVSANRGEPDEHSPWMEGDPRNIFNRGVGIEMSVFAHAELALIAKAAHDGVSVKGGSMYVTDFPCPVCAKLIAHSGVKNLYYSKGYAVLDGKTVLEKYGVNLFRVSLDEAKNNTAGSVPYKKKPSG